MALWVAEADLVVLNKVGDRCHKLLVDGGCGAVEPVGRAWQLGSIGHLCLMFHKLEQLLLLPVSLLHWPRGNVGRGIAASTITLVEFLVEA